MSELNKFRLINKIEGYSFLLLLFVAMPLKYMAGFPIATKIAGMIHGVLFIGFIYQLIVVTDEVPFSKKEAFIFFVASVVPFGSFYNENICKVKN
jgi:integral membrane protein